MDISLIKSLVDKGHSSYQIAEELKMSQTGVRYWLKKLRLKTHVKNKTSKKFLSIDWSQIQKDHDLGYSWASLRDKYHITMYGLSKATKLGLFISRSSGESCALAHATGVYNYNSHRTQEYRAKMSKYGGLKIRAGRCKIINYENLSGEAFPLQGVWELELAKYLNSRKENWIKNTKPFPYEFAGKKRKYYPDFYLPSRDVFIEVKGYETAKDLAKWSAFPNKLLICRREDINNLDEFWSYNFKRSPSVERRADGRTSSSDHL